MSANIVGIGGQRLLSGQELLQRRSKPAATNDRIEVFDTNGNFLAEQTGLRRPSTVFFDSNEDAVYVAELDY